MTTSHTDPASRKTAVIIPYYQEEPGILREAVLSAIAQEGVSDLEIIVVDDGSPAPSRDELKSLDLPAHVTLKLIEQENRGPGAARNRALDFTSPDTAYVAFLDSDDTWSPTHLSAAVHTLRAGYDFYFSDADVFGERLFHKQYFDTHKHQRLDDERNVYAFSGNLCLTLIGSSFPVHTSTVAYRYDKFPELRFPEGFFMGEDVTVWMAVARQSDRIAFSTNLGCTLGHGVHIARDSRWGTEKHIWQLYNFMVWRQWYGENVEMKPEERRENTKNIRETRRKFVAALLHELRRCRVHKDAYVGKFLQRDPVVLLYIIPIAIQIALKKLRLGPDKKL